MSPLAQQLGASSFVIGLVVGIYSFSNTIGNVISGFVTDRNGPFLALVIGLFASGFALFFYGLPTEPYTLLGVRFAHGFMEGLIVPAAFTFLANRAESSKRGRSVAISGAFVGLAAIIGPAYSGIVSVKTSPSFIMMMNGVFMILLGIGAILFLRKVAPVRKTKEKIEGQVRVRYLFQHPGIIRAFAGAFFLMFSQGVLALLLPLKVEFLQFDASKSGTLFSTFGIVAILVFLLPINRIFDKAKPMVTLAFGISLMGLSMVFLSTVDDLHELYIAMAVYGVGFAFLFPSINSLLIDSTTPSFRGKAYGYFYAFFSIGVVVGSSVIGALNLTFKGGFLLTGILLLCVAIFTIFGFVHRHNKHTHLA